MLEIRPTCEHCTKALPNESNEAMICAFECTFCITCVEEILQNVCPNCGGGFEKRPTMPKKYLEKYPASTKQIHKTIDRDSYYKLVKKNKDIDPRER